MNKYFVISVLVISFLAMGTFALAQTTGTQTSQTTVATCVASAVAAREAAIQTAFSTYSSAISTGLTQRATSLAAAWQMTDKAERNTAIKDAHAKFKAVKTTAKQAYTTAKNVAWTAFSTARKACKVPATGEDHAVDNL